MNLLNIILKSLLLWMVLIGVWVSTLLGDQPIMNMMPRWDGGYGFQVLYDSIHRGQLFEGDRVLDSNRSEDIRLLHLQGVYTWDRSIRMTVKIPYALEAERENLDGSVDRYEGLGDVTFALPLKQYFNLDGRSGSWTLTPQLVVPMSSYKENGGDAYDVFSRRWGSGLFAGYETETFRWFFAVGASYWVYEKDKPEVFKANLDMGVNPTDATQVLLEIDYRSEDDGAGAWTLGPSFYYRQNLQTHWRIELKKDYHESVGRGRIDYASETKLSVGVGFVF